MVSVPSSISYKRISGGGLSGYTGGGGSGGGGGGSEKENNATFGQDPFYNYIKTVDQYTHSLEALERELDILSDKDAVRDNLSA
nr:MAG TPA: Intron-binding protein aquarius N-terminus [Caudoviricetes sp.]